MKHQGNARHWAHRNVGPVLGNPARHKLADPADAVHKMWQRLRHEFGHMHFRRQVVIAGAIADFASHRARLIIEVDSGVHAANTDEACARMAEADGYRILRVWNNDILQNMPGVCELIHTMLNVSAPANEK